MSYFRVLGMRKEPFSTSPDPAFLYLSRRHKAALYKLQIALKLRRGLSVILGDVGTGKTSLSRRLSQMLRAQQNVAFHMILNPRFNSEAEFLDRIARMFRIRLDAGAAPLDYIEAIERHLFKSGVEEGKTTILLIDESQMLPEFALEVLRILLNYETNEYKLLQLILVGQLELLPKLSRIHNFWDRIALKYELKPLDEDEVREMIDFRLREAGYAKPAPLFTPEAVRAIAEQSGGYPRKLSILCHNALEHLVMYDEVVVLRETVRDLIEGDVQPLGSVAGEGVPHVVR